MLVGISHIERHSVGAQADPPLPGRADDESEFGEQRTPADEDERPLGPDEEDIR